MLERARCYHDSKDGGTMKQNFAGPIRVQVSTSKEDQPKTFKNIRRQQSSAKPIESKDGASKRHPSLHKHPIQVATMPRSAVKFFELPSPTILNLDP